MGSQTFIAKITFESIPNQLRIIEYNRKLSLARVSSIEYVLSSVQYRSLLSSDMTEDATSDAFGLIF